MPAEPVSNNESIDENIRLEGLQRLFHSSEFEANSSLTELGDIFLAESSDEEFLGFEWGYGASGSEALFISLTPDEEFLGFWC